MLKYVLLLLFGGFFVIAVQAQPTTINTLQHSPVQEKDLVDLIRSLRKHSYSDVVIDTAKMAKLHFSIVPAVGYTLSSGLTGIVASNIGFYLSDPETTNMSSVSATVVYSQYKQLTIPLQTNIWTRDNNYNIVTDLRYYKYPQNTYGLGNNSSLKNADLIDYSHIHLHFSVLKKLVPNLYGGIGYFYDYHWNVKESGLPDSSISDAKRYGLNAHSSSSGPVVNLLYDNRKNSINPANGLYADVLYRNNLRAFNSDNNWQGLILDVRKYIKFPANSNNIWAFWSYNWLTLSGKPPYLDLPSTGWDAYNNTGRGYIQGRFRGKNMFYVESEYRMQLSRNGLFGAVLFVNGETFSRYVSYNINQKVWPGWGVGLRIKVNKHSKANIAIDYGFGADGSHGLFVNLGEVF